MERDFMDRLVVWRESARRKPMLLSGVRQCGKTYLLRIFGKKHYRQCLYVNFERQPDAAAVFESTLDPNEIVKQLSLTQPGFSLDEPDTLYIFDEVQAAPKALTSLKYFAEERPDLHVIGAGSLLGVALRRGESFPVGKVDIETLHPMSFAEFVHARRGAPLLTEIVGKDRAETLTKLDRMSAVVRGQLQDLFQEYVLVGGMPEAVKAWIATQDMQEVDRVHTQLIHAYQADFAKHAPAADIPKLTAIWASIPAQLAKANQKFVFGHAMKGKRAADLADALQWLTDAGLVTLVRNVENPAIPLAANANPAKFKVFMCDVGLLRALAQLPPVPLADITERSTSYYGALGENYVLNELTKAGFEPFYWTSKATAEVDFLIQSGAQIIPIEVKAATNTNAKSLTQYRKRYAPSSAFKISLRDFTQGEGLTNLPHYCTPALPQVL